ncbi:MAG TPA: hypothetical protein VNT50_07905, partial [Microbacterium sp.]|uniref:hypothetical protein n=1 Tax=Microbacterium sp. TaxID=51671 RepID=UPI002BED9C48
MDSEPHHFRRRVRMPAGRHFAVTWAIPDDFGGMTEAMFRRSRAFDQLGGVAVDVLTFDARPDYPALEATLRGQGVLSAGVRIVNLYDWLREHALSARDADAHAAAQAFAPIKGGEGVQLRTRDGQAMSRVRTDAHGNALQIDHLRADGTVVVSDRRDVRRAGTVGGRSVVLCDRRGKPVRAWAGIWGLYTAWLDELTGSTSSYMIVDSKTIATFMLSYRRPHVVTVHLVHGSHRG